MKNIRQDAIRSLVIMGGFLATLGVGHIDRISGHETSLSVFYLIPVCAVACFAGRLPGVVIAVLAGFAWAIADLPLAGEVFEHFSFYWVAVSNIAIFIIFVFMSHELKNAFIRERQLARKDFVTGVANSKAFFDICAKEIARTKRLSMPVTIAYMDCDNFKGINDSMGHEAGNRFLRVVAESVRRSIRLSDTLARIGGDEFAVLLPETNRQAAKYFVERLRGILAKVTKDHGFPVTFSMGVATFDRAPLSVDEMMKKSDGLMYSAKKHGKDQAVFEVF